jgi:hypothetical protein
MAVTLLRVHRLFMVVCIVFLLGYAAWEAKNGAAWRGGVAVLAAAALGVYLRTLRSAA